MMEMERETNDLLIIAHESVLRVLYAYFMGSGTDVSLDKFCAVVTNAVARKFHILNLNVQKSSKSFRHHTTAKFAKFL